MIADEKIESPTSMSIDLVADLTLGMHVCWFNDTARDLVETLVQFFEQGLLHR
jgi:hypothetical protein